MRARLSAKRSTHHPTVPPDHPGRQAGQLGSENCGGQVPQAGKQPCPALGSSQRDASIGVTGTLVAVGAENCPDEECFLRLAF